MKGGSANSNPATPQDCPDLVSKAEDYISRNFTDVAKSQEFFMLSYSQICEIINLQKYPFRNEQVIIILRTLIESPP